MQSVSDTGKKQILKNFVLIKHYGLLTHKILARPEKQKPDYCWFYDYLKSFAVMVLWVLEDVMSLSKIMANKFALKVYTLNSMVPGNINQHSAPYLDFFFFVLYFMFNVTALKT